MDDLWRLDPKNDVSSSKCNALTNSIRRKHLELYRLWSADPTFKAAMQQYLRAMVEAWKQ